MNPQNVSRQLSRQMYDLARENSQYLRQSRYHHEDTGENIGAVAFPMRDQVAVYVNGVRGFIHPNGAWESEQDWENHLEYNRYLSKVYRHYNNPYSTR